MYVFVFVFKGPCCCTCTGLVLGSIGGALAPVVGHLYSIIVLNVYNSIFYLDKQELSSSQHEIVILLPTFNNWTRRMVNVVIIFLITVH